VDWFEDPGYPSYSGYYTVDEEAIYIGIVLDIDNVDDANLRFAFRAEASDYLIKITEEGDCLSIQETLQEHHGGEVKG